MAGGDSATPAIFADSPGALEGHGDFYDPIHDFRAKLAQYALPESLWSALIVLHMSHEGHRLDLVPMLFVCAMTVAIQLGFIFYVKESLDNQDSIDDDSFTLLTYCCVATLVASVQGSKVRQCQDILQWVRNWPGSGDPAKPRFAVRHKHFKQKDMHQDVQLDYWEPDGYISCLDRILFFLLLAARLSLALVVMFFGALLILGTKTTEERILNTAGLLFILDIDDIFYKVITPASVKHMIAQLEPIGLSVWRAGPRTTLATFLGVHFGSILNTILFLLVTVVMTCFALGKLDVVIGLGSPIVLGLCCCFFLNCLRCSGPHQGSNVFWDAGGTMVGRLSNYGEQNIKDAAAGNGGIMVGKLSKE